MVVVEVSAKVDVCTHPGSFGDMCILCGQRLEGEAGVTLGYIHKVYIISCEWLTELQIKVGECCCITVLSPYC